MLELTVAQISKLFREAKVPCSNESLIRVRVEREKIFHDCETWEDAIQRLKELSVIVKF